MEEFYKQCQSCGMPLKKGEKSGTEQDGSKSLKYCHMCYKDGKFCDPNMTMEDMKGIIKKNVKWPLSWFANMQLPRLERWKK